MKRVLMIVVVMGLVSCGGPPQPRYKPLGAGPAPSSGAKPSWVDGSPARYTQHLTAVGRGPSRQTCENDARAAMAKIFIAKIQQVSRDWQSYFSRVGNVGGNVKVEAMSISQLIRVSTDKVLKGVKIAEVWVGGNTTHCLATLERFPAAQSLREQIQRLDAEMAMKLRLGDEAQTPTAKYMAYARAMELMQEREALNVDLRIVNPRGGGLQAPRKWEELVAKFEMAKTRIKVGLKLTGTKSKKIQTCLVEQLTKQGMEILEGTSDIDLIIHGKLKYQKAGVIAGSVMVRAEINLRINDVETGRTLSAFSKEIKVGRPTLQRSVQLAVFKLCKQVVPKLAAEIRKSFRK